VSSVFFVQKRGKERRGKVITVDDDDDDYYYYYYYCISSHCFGLVMLFRPIVLWNIGRPIDP
jgi:hypothetical protein